MLSCTKKQKAKPFRCFLIETTRLSASLEDLNNALAQSDDELWPLAKMVKVTFCGM